MPNFPPSFERKDYTQTPFKVIVENQEKVLSKKPENTNETNFSIFDGQCPRNILLYYNALLNNQTQVGLVLAERTFCLFLVWFPDTSVPKGGETTQPNYVTVIIVVSIPVPVVGGRVGLCFLVP